MSKILDTKQSMKIDENSRDTIINCLNKNLFVIAGAGSGKTSMLVSRMVAMVESGIDVSKICAITFTKKAAAEFLERFQKKLKERSVVPLHKSTNKRPGELPDPTTTTAPLCKKALKDIDLCFTGTIDSFCNLVLAEYPNDAKIPSSSVVVMDDELVELCKKEYKNIANNPSHPLKTKFDVFNKLFTNGAEVFSKSIQAVIDYAHFNIVFDRPTKSADAALLDLKNEYYDDIINDLDAIHNATKASVVDFRLFNDAYDSFETQLPSLKKDWKLDGISYYRKAIKKALEGIRFIDEPTLTFFDTKYIKQSTLRSTGEVKPAGYDFNFDVEKGPYETFCNKVQALIYKYALDFLVDAANEIRDVLKKQGKLSFNEYLITFRDMVKEDMNNGMNLINHIRNKHQYFLLDESQDTSPIQTELFVYLSSSIPATTMEKCKPIPGRLFIVGDPKQSIYAFRGADVDAYLNTKTLFESVYDQQENEVVYLTKNFRSTSELCEYFNSQFKDLDNYDPIPISCIDVPDKSIENDVLSGVYACSNHVAAIKELVGKHFIFDKEIAQKEDKTLEKDPHAFDKTPRTYGKRLIEYKDVMLLTWSKTKHNDILKELMEEHIPVYCEGKFDISDNDIIQTVYALFAYIVDEPGALVNVLSSPLFAILPNDLSRIVSINDLPNCDQKDLLLDVESLKDVEDPIIVFDTLIKQMVLYEIVNSSNYEYLMFTFEKLKEAYNSKLISGLRSAFDFLKDFVQTPLERCANLKNKPDAVFLANVHKVKGLERPVVILFESSPATNRQEISDSDYQTGEAYIFRTSENEKNRVKYYDIESGDQFVKQEAKSKSKKEEEEKRLGYVAVTRARNILAIPPKNRGSSVWDYIRTNDLKEIPPSTLPDIVFDTADEFSSEEPGAFNPTPTYEEMSPSKQAHLLSKNNDSNDLDDSAASVSEEGNDSTIKGTIVHRLMEKLVNSKGKIAKDALIESILNEYYLDKGSVYDSILNNVYDTMTSGGYPQKNSVSQDLLKELEGLETICECPYSFKKGNEIWQGSIDLIYIKDGKYYIIDYKTNADDEDLETLYANQLAAYVEALKTLRGVDAEAHIYHIDIK